MEIFVTPEPDSYRLICAVARRYARKEVETQLRDEGRRLSLVPLRDIKLRRK
jgi:hypothetical protein